VLSTSEPNTNANHTITFTLPDNTPGATGLDADDEIRITLPPGFTVPLIDDDDVDIEVASSEETMATDWDATSGGQVITITSTGGTASQGDDIQIEIGDNATNEATGDSFITNHTATGSYEMLIEIYDEGTTLQDSASTMLVVVDQVTVTADVDPIFDFFVTGTTTGVTIGGEAMTATTTSTEIPFGTLNPTPGNPEVAAQDLRVVTNAVGGFSVTVATDQQLTASNLATIDSFDDGSDQPTPLAWQSPGGDIGDNNTWGHWGVRSDDSDLAVPFPAGQYEYVPLLASSTPREVFSHNAPVNGYGSADDEGSTKVLYKVEIMSFQEAADDYTANLTYVATPTF
jgi:hypothetical protein